MTSIKKYTLLLIFIQLINTMSCQAALTQHDTFVWEQYMSLQSMGYAAAGIVLYNLIMTPKDLTFQTFNKTIAQDALKSFEHITIYYPGTDCSPDDVLQSLSNQTQHKIITLHESNISRYSLILLFDQAIKLSPCILYIHTHKKYLTNLNNSDHGRAFLKEMHDLKKNDNSVLVIGHAKNNNLQTINDIFTISINITNQCPSYQERLEFLHLLLAIENSINLDAQELAKKTIAFSYEEIINFVQKIKYLSHQNMHHAIKNNVVEEAYKAISKSQSMEQSQYLNIHRTSVHEMGHAVATALFPSQFILHNVSSTPHVQLDSITHGVTQITRKSISYQKEYELIPLYEHHIMILFAGKIAEQMIFGLPNNKELNANNGYNDLINNPRGAEDDLFHARSIAHQIDDASKGSIWGMGSITIKDDNSLMQPIYAKALKLMLPYTNTIKQGAQLLEEQEFLSGSQVHNIVYGHTRFA